MTSGARLRASIAGAAPLLVFAGGLHAADAPEWTFARLMAELAQVQTSHARYSEVRRISMLEQPLELSGTLSYSRPGRIEKNQILPFRETLRIDADKITVERDGRTRTVAMRDSPLAAALVETLRAILAGDAAGLGRLYEASVRGPRERWELRLRPREPEVTAIVNEIDVRGSGSRVGRIEIRVPGGDRSVMTILPGP
jgi:outer membrane lipoprotein carrier protein LolA